MHIARSTTEYTPNTRTHEHTHTFPIPYRAAHPTPSSSSIQPKKEKEETEGAKDYMKKQGHQHRIEARYKALSHQCMQPRYRTRMHALKARRYSGEHIDYNRRDLG